MFIYLFIIYNWLTANEITVYNKNSCIDIYHIYTDVNFQLQKLKTKRETIHKIMKS